MSFSKPKLERPFSKTIKWKGSDGGSFSYWDGENNVPISIEDFIVLEEMSSISGYHSGKNKGIWSNEVMDLRKEKLTVRVGNEIATEGIYGEIKEEIRGYGGKFTNVVFALLKGEIVRILFSGSGCSGWIDKGFNPMSRQCGVRFSGTTQGQTGSVVFFTPIFQPVELTHEQINEAHEQCEILETWLKSRDSSYEPTDPDGPTSHETDDLEEANNSFQRAGLEDEVPF